MQCDNLSKSIPGASLPLATSARPDFAEALGDGWLPEQYLARFAVEEIEKT